MAAFSHPPPIFPPHRHSHEPARQAAAAGRQHGRARDRRVPFRSASNNSSIVRVGAGMVSLQLQSCLTMRGQWVQMNDHC